MFPWVHYFKTRHQLKDNDSLFSLVPCFKTFPHFPHKIKQTLWVLSSYASHSLYIPTHILSRYLILNTHKIIQTKKDATLWVQHVNYTFPTSWFISVVTFFECWLVFFFFSNILASYFTKQKRDYRLHNLLSCNLLLKSKSLYSHFTLALIL